MVLSSLLVLETWCVALAKTLRLCSDVYLESSQEYSIHIPGVTVGLNNIIYSVVYTEHLYVYVTIEYMNESV